MSSRVLFSSLALLVCAAAPAAGQLPWRAGAGVTFESYSFSAPGDVDLDRVTLLTAPFSIDARVWRQLEMRISAAYADGRLTRADGQEVSLSGLTDTELRLTYDVVPQRVRVSAIGLLPTGKSELTADQMDVAGVIAADVLPFTISSWGTGGGVGASAAATLPIGSRMAVGISAGYVLAREFEPLAETAFAYRPGNQLHVRAAIDRSVGVTDKASIQVSYQHFSADELSGSNLYQSGDRFQALASYAFAAGFSSSGVAYAGYLRREPGEYTEVVHVTPAQDLLYFGLGLRMPWRGVVLLPAIDGRVVGNEAGVDQGFTMSGGAGVEIPVARLVVVPQARVRVGRLVSRNSLDSNFTGFEVGASLRGGTWR